jgi:hypothetical protein
MLIAVLIYSLAWFAVDYPTVVVDLTLTSLAAMVMGGVVIGALRVVQMEIAKWTCFTPR